MFESAIYSHYGSSNWWMPFTRDGNRKSISADAEALKLFTAGVASHNGGWECRSGRFWMRTVMSEQGQATLAWMSVSKPFEPEAVDFLMAESEEELEARSKEFVWRTAAQLVAQVLCPWWELNMDGAKTDMMTVKNLVQEVLRMREVVPWARLHYSIEPDELDKEAGGVRQPSDPLRLYLFDGSFIRLTEKGPQQPGREKEADAELLMVRSTEHDLRKMEVTTPIQ